MSSFLKIILKDYWRVAAFYPTPKKVVKKILSKVPKGTKYFLEYGPGNGAFTQEILKRLPKDGKLFAFETNQDFIEELKKIKDSRIVIFILKKYFKKINWYFEPHIFLPYFIVLARK
ncbi:MAG: Ribosomal RNA small subunit methyltransferase A [candidate division WS2 bacterium]|nr:Ribosomal RNA small subunit methyltransferase A [Candidatus Lithacetigena glycinireducens]